jgi:hypothetical protein
VAVVIDEVEQEDVVIDQRTLRGAVRLPPARIVFVPFSLVEVEIFPDDEYPS